MKQFNLLSAISKHGGFFRQAIAVYVITLRFRNFSTYYCTKTATLLQTKMNKTQDTAVA